jgi:hypothetical protein
MQPDDDTQRDSTGDRFFPGKSGRFLWLFPAGLFLHDLEELLAMPAWTTSHADFIARVAAHGRVGARVAANIRAPFSETALAVFIVVAAAFAITWVTLRRGRRDSAFTLYLVILGMAFLHVFVHIAQAVVVGGYIPGLAGAVVILLPCCILVYRSIFREGVATRLEAIFAAITGIALFIPVVVFVKIVASLLTF